MLIMHMPLYLDGFQQSHAFSLENASSLVIRKIPCWNIDPISAHTPPSFFFEGGGRMNASMFDGKRLGAFQSRVPLEESE